MTPDAPPLAVKLVAWVDFAGAGLLALLASAELAAYAARPLRPLAPFDVGPEVGVIGLAGAALGAGLGWAIWRGKRWARVVQVIAGIGSIVGTAGSLVDGEWATLASLGPRGYLFVAWEILDALIAVLVLWLLTRPMARWWFRPRPRD